MPLKFTSQIKNQKVAIPSLDDDTINAIKPPKALLVGAIAAAKKNLDKLLKDPNA
jgi:hypothetical protein